MPAIKKILPWILTVFLTAGCAGCARQNPEEGSGAPPGSSGQTAVSSFEGTNAAIPKSSLNQMVGDTLYCVDSTWDEDSRKMRNPSILRLRKGDAELETLAQFGDAEFLLFFADESESLYCLYAGPGENADAENYFFRKLDPDGRTVYDMPVSYQGTPGGEGVLSRFGTVAAGGADGEGRACLAGTHGDLYLFGADGQLARIGAAPWTAESYNGSTCGLVSAGEEGLYAYLINGKNLSLQKVDMTDGTLGAAIQVPTADMADASLEIYSGYSLGLLISDSSALWKYDIAKGELARLLNWGDNTVGLKDHIINAVGILADGSLYVAAHPPGKEMSLISIASRNASEIPEKQTVVLARIKMFENMLTFFDTAAALYNRQNTEYQVELRSYDSLFELEAALLKGEGPDLFCLGDFGLDVHLLASKNVLEDLSPYFAESSAIHTDDLLPAVRDAGMIDGKFLCVIPSFTVKGVMTAKGTTAAGLWTAEDYVALGEDNPDIPLEFCTDPKYYYNSVLKAALKGDMERYVDWTQGKCYFDSDSFISLLDRISRLNPHGDGAQNRSYSADADIDRISNRQELTAPWSIEDNGILKYYLDAIDSGASIELAGYPYQGTEPCYGLFSIEPLGMNSASHNKEAAWSFLEFFLLETINEEYGIPVRQDAFEKFLDRETDRNGKDMLLSEEEKELFRDIVAHTHWTTASNTTDILYIISEEAGAVWAGDKTARQAAEIIQNRVGLFLKE